MIPVKLKLKGMYSYLEEQEIDFTQLTAAGLFGIFGAVGSGKSTLLEAITFALYGETERLGSREDRAYNMMNLRASELQIEFIFRAGASDGELYRFAVRGTRNKKDFRTVKKLDRVAYRKSGDQWLPLGSADGEKVTGLSYENFRRTIIIPQGKFQDFLQLKPADRSTMLMELFELEKFDLQQPALALLGRANDKLTDLRARLDQLGNTDAERIREFETRLVQLQVRAAEIQNALVDIQSRISRQERARDAAAKRNQAQDVLRTLQDEEPAFLHRKQELIRYDETFRRYSLLMNEIRKYEEAQRETEREKSEREARIRLDRERLAEDEKEFFSVQEAWNNRDQLQRQSERMLTLSQWKDKQEEIAGLNDALSGKLSALQQANQERQKLQDEALALREEVREARINQTDISLLVQTENGFRKLHDLKARCHNREEALQQHAKEIRVAENAWDRFRQTDLLPVLQKEDTLPDDPEQVMVFLEDKEKKAQEFIRQKQAELVQLQTRARLSDYSRNLTEGEPCPVCGSTHHPAVSGNEDVHASVTALNTLLQKADERREMIRKLRDQLMQKAELAKSLSRRQQELHDELKKAQAEMDSHIAAFNWNGYSPDEESRLQTVIANVREQNRKTEETEKRLHMTDDRLRKQNLLCETMRQQTEEETGRIRMEEGRLVQLEKDKTEWDAGWMNKSSTALRQRSAEIRESIASLQLRFTEMETRMSQARTQLAREEGNLQALVSRIRETEVSLSHARSTLSGKLQESGEAENEIRDLLSRKTDWDAERKFVGEFESRISLARSQFEAARQQAAENPFSEDEWKAATAEQLRLQQEMDALRVEQGEISARLGQSKQDLAERERLGLELKQWEQRRMNLDSICKLFRGKGFVDFVSSMYLRELVNRANERFVKLTRNTLRIELSPDNDFWVRDYVNSGQIRSIKTLSGGQTFQASLCLALALADSIQKQAGNAENFFFLDEGFGTLDKDSLRLVFETLKSLRKENRVVGIISHVEELQQEITAFVRVDADEEHGSQLHFSWV